jgi:hypothetical protein
MNAKRIEFVIINGRSVDHVMRKLHANDHAVYIRVGKEVIYNEGMQATTKCVVSYNIIV